MIRSYFNIALFAGLLLLTACGGESPVGKWTIDVDKTFEASPEITGSIPADQLETALKVMKPMMAKMTAEFMADGTAKMTTPDGKVEEMKWTQSGGKLTLEGAGEGPDEITLKGDTLILTGKQDGKTLQMHMVRAKG